ncbi:MAG: hypothetical protein ACYCUT_10730 [bacterium]
MDILRPLGIKDIVKTGIIALQRTRKPSL